MAVMNPYNYRKPIGASIVNNKKEVAEVSTVAKTNSKVDTYLELKVMNARPEELTQMLYDGLVKFIGQAKIFNDQGHVEKSNAANIRAQEIIQELRSSLNMDIEISKNLEMIYLFMLDQLVEANVTKSNETLENVSDLAKDLRDTWKQAMNL